MKFHGRVVAAVALALTAAPIVGVTTAQAASSDCPRDNFCTWSNLNYTGSLRYTNATVKQTSFPQKNDVESIYNNSAYTACIVDTDTGRKSEIPGRTLRNLSGTALNSIDVVYTRTYCSAV